jgi:PEP-CTERM motif
MRSRSPIWIVALAVIVQTGVCTPLYEVSGTSAPLMSGSSPVTTTGSFTDGIVGWDTFARADQTVGISILTLANATGSLTNHFTGGISASADSEFDDIIISSTDPNATTTTLSFDLPFDVILSRDYTVWAGANGISFTGENLDFFALGNFGFRRYGISLNSQGSAQETVMGASATLAVISDLQQLLVSAPGEPADAGIRHIQQYLLQGAIHFVNVQVPVGTPLGLQLVMQGSAATTSNSAAGAHNGIFGVHTFGPAVGVPVFDLLPGFTANSVQMGIVDDVIPNQGTVPEPASLATAGIGMAVLLLGTNRHRRRA